MEAMNHTSVKLRIEGGVAEMQLIPLESKPPTLSHEVLEKLDACLEAIEQSSARIVYLTSASSKYFCAGANIEVLKQTNLETIGPWIETGHRVLNRLEDLPCPVVSLIRGYAMGGGLEIALACDLIFTDESAKLAQSEARLGFIPGWGGCRRLVDRVGISKAKYLFYSGSLLEGKAAHEYGLVDFCGTAEELSAYKDQFTESVLKNNYNAISTFKRIVDDEQKAARVRNAEAEATNSVSCLKDEDTLKRLDDFLNRKK